MDGLKTGDPQRIGGYWLAGRIGEGGQGVVYEAYDIGGRRVALKVLHTADDEESRQRFAREATAATRVASFCTARILDVELSGPRPYLVSEYVPGPNLRRAVAEGRVFAGDGLHRLATAIATALTAIHEAGVIHRDLKPDNVLLGPDGPRVIDFGVARTPEMSLTKTGQATGTPSYMAPEIFTGQRATAASDVFAWGAIVLFAATGTDPFHADTLGATMHRVLSEQPDLSALPPRLAPLVEAALCKEPGDRPTARDLLLALVSGPATDTAVLLAEGARTAGGVRMPDSDPALGVLAEDAYHALTPEERELIASVFLRLVTVAEDGREVGRRAPLHELLDGRSVQEAAAVRRILQVFSYLLEVKEDSVALARPGVLRAWPRLRAWVDAERDGLPMLGRLTEAARNWAEHGHRDGDLWQGSTLEQAMNWGATGRRHVTLTSREQRFLQAAAGLARRRDRRRRLTVTALGALLVVALGTGAVAVDQGQEMAEQRDAALARKITLEADTLRAADPVKAMLLNVAAWRLSRDVDTHAGLADALRRRERAALPEFPGVATLSHDGRTLVTLHEGQVTFTDLRTGEKTGGWHDPDLAKTLVHAIALNASGRLLAVESGRGVTVRDARTGAERAKRESAEFYFKPEIEFTAHETLLAVGTPDGAFDYLWDVESGRVYGKAVPEDYQPSQVAVAPDGSAVAMVDEKGRLRAWGLPDWTPDTRFARACSGPGPKVIAFSPDSRRLACAGSRVRLLDLGTGKAQTWDWDHRGDPEDRGVRAEVEAQSFFHTGLRFNADGTLLAGFADRTVRVWRVAGPRHALHHQADTEIADVRFDGGLLRYRTDDAVVGLAAEPQLRARQIGKAAQAALSPDGRRLALWSTGPVQLWDVATGRLVGNVGADVAAELAEVSFDPRGEVMVIAESDGGFLQAWDLAAGTELWRVPIGNGIGVGRPVFTADGKIVVVEQGVMGDGGLVPPEPPLVYEARTGRKVDGSALGPADRPLLDGAGRAALSSGGLLAGDGGGGRIALTGPEGRRTLLRGGNEPVAVLAFDPGGTLLAAADESGDVRLWDMATRRPLGGAVALLGEVDSLAFSPDRTVLYAWAAGRLHEIPVEGDRMAAELCERAGRDLTEQEWAEHLPGMPWRPVCPS